MDTVRTFIALELPKELKEGLSLIQQQLMKKTRAVRWVKPDNMHLTLKFLGPTSKDAVPEICRKLEETTCGLNRFLLKLTGLGAFPNSFNPKVIWAGIERNEDLWGFQERLEEALETTGFPREKRPFSPHLTLGRLRDMRRRREAGTALESVRLDNSLQFKAVRIIFYRSDLLPEGPIYTHLKEINLS